ncbi:tetratricopeptide repeat protein [Tautonia plasticadhaerens]|uniref:Bacteriophage N4 receptor, outer membrane subunit n=1 Tax=Tautonia plasticadhaerens TaxID=2527974 RepID=A0A518GV24_9BACT|nr:tetratricopeptide repeat protein [Tautonia plasticadhaerens]QDV32441.1 bacteriophage N4 receptor, outer membrane subunit [Tautonia plasticadhaerens]
MNRRFGILGPLRLALVAMAATLLLRPSGAGADSFDLSDLLLEPGRPIRLLPRNIEEVDRAAEAFRGGDEEGALRLLESAAEKHPSLPPARAILAMLCFSADRVPQARLLLERAASESPEDPTAYTLFGKLALAERRVTDAKLAFEKAAGLGPPPSWTELQRRELDLTCREGLATVAEARGDWSSAREHLEAWLALEPADATARHRLGRALFWLGEVGPAREALSRASGLSPSLEPPDVTLARLFALKGDVEQAGRRFDRAIDDAPDDPRPFVAKAAWLLDRGLPGQIAPLVDELGRITPDSTDLGKLRGLLARSRGDSGEAERHFRSLLERDPGDAFARDQLALVLADQDDPEKRRKALELAEMNARLSPEGPRALSTLGWARFRAGLAEPAEQALRLAVARGESSPDTAYFLARVLDASGRPDDAETLIRLALGRPGTFFARDRARSWLDDREADGGGDAP